VYRGVAYDLASFIPHHPGGAWLINLAVGRDATALFESYHLRCEAAAAVFGKLPQLQGFPVHAVPCAPRELAA
jgi:fatty acid desaturase (delta-4 desaturase)